MRRRAFITLLGGTAVAEPADVDQKPGRMRRWSRHSGDRIFVATAMLLLLFGADSLTNNTVAQESGVAKTLRFGAQARGILMGAESSPGNALKFGPLRPSRTQFAAVQRYGRCRWSTGRLADAAGTAAPDPEWTLAAATRPVRETPQYSSAGAEYARSRRPHLRTGPRRAQCGTAAGRTAFFCVLCGLLATRRVVTASPVAADNSTGRSAADRRTGRRASADRHMGSTSRAGD